MSLWEEVESAVESRSAYLREAASQIKNDIEAYRTEMAGMIEDAKKNEILAELKKVNTRLDAMERRLPPEQLDTVAGDGEASRKIR